MNKFKIFIIISIVSLCAFFIILETYFLFSIYIESKNINKKDPEAAIPFGWHKSYISNFINNFWNSFDGRYYDKKAYKTIMVLGCSYAEGAGLNINENLEYQLSNSLGYNVINSSFGGHGLSSAYKLLSEIEKDEEEFTSKYNIDLFIYVYIKDHLRRLYEKNSLFSGEIYPQYKIVKNRLVEIKPHLPFLYSLYSVANFNNRLMLEKMRKEEKTYKMFNIMISELQKITKRLYPNSKFMILVVPTKYTNDIFAIDSMFPEEELKKLQDMGLIIVNAEDLTSENLRDEKWYIEDKCHPSSDYWKLIIPKLSQIIKQEIK